MDNPVEQENSRILVVGSGRLASELLENLGNHGAFVVLPWASKDLGFHGRTFVVHAGSGRERDEVISYCSRNALVLVELATSEELGGSSVDFPVVVCSNNNILILKFLAMLRTCGHHLAEYTTEILESHQASKVTKPGTAISLARYLSTDPDSITSVRDPEIQRRLLQIPPEHLARHAYHRIHFSDGNAEITLETRVHGPAPYSAGLGQILRGLQNRSLEPKIYDVVDLVADGWIL